MVIRHGAVMAETKPAEHAVEAPPIGLEELAAAVPGAVCAEPTLVRRLTHDSRDVRPGDLFFALPGTQHDGHRFVPDARARGAAAAVVDHPMDVAIAQVVVPSVRRAVGPIAAAFYRHPADRMHLMGVTGTNGKTTVCSLLRQCLGSAGVRAGQIGTVGSYVGDEVLPPTLTTPQATDLQRTLWEMAATGIQVVAMEASSHGLDQHRLDGISFDVGVFTNLSREHLDYHHSMEAYFAAKAGLLDPGRCRFGIVGVDDSWGRRLAGSAAIPLLTVGRDRSSDVVVAGVENHGLDGIEVHLTGVFGRTVIRSPLVGAFNAPNLAMAYAVARHAGLAEAEAVGGLGAAGPAPGRFELVQAGQPFLVVVDYAHTPAALAALLASTRPLAAPTVGRITLVLGARGGRDRGKRPQTGAVAVRGADRVVFTADNPGDEPVASIISDLQAGVPGADGDRVEVVADRREAIELAVTRAAPGDVVLIVGRGHEKTFRNGSDVVTLDDREAAAAAARRWRAELCG